MITWLRALCFMLLLLVSTLALAQQGQSVQISGSRNDRATAVLSTLDAATIKNNAAREAWGYKVQAQDYQNRGDILLTNADNEATSTLLTGSSNLLLAQ
jgi:hypothetical protein